MNIDITKIKVDKSSLTMKRVREDLGDLTGLRDSIARLGIIHPVTVERIEEDKYDFVLIAGERRLRSCLLLGKTEIPAILKYNIDDISKKEIELEENLHRQELHWGERCEALRQLDNLKRKKYGDAAARPDGKKGGGVWGIKETAQAVGRSAGAVSQDIQLAKALKKNPELAKTLMKLPKHAARKKIEQDNRARRLATQIANSELIIDSSLRHGSCTDLIKELEDGSVHMILTDPPFAVDKIISVAEGSKTGKGFGGTTYNLTKTHVGIEDEMTKVYDILIPELYRVMAPGGHIYMFFGHTWYHRLYTMLSAAGFEMYDMPIIWDKMQASMIPKDSNYMASYEAIMFGYKPPLTRLLRKPTRNIISEKAIPGGNRLHPLEKPTNLLQLLIENSTSPGEVVLDCFAGSASTLRSAVMLSRRAIGFELDEGNYLRAQEQLSKVEEANKNLLDDTIKGK